MGKKPGEKIIFIILQQKQFHNLELQKTNTIDYRTHYKLMNFKTIWT